MLMADAVTTETVFNGRRRKVVHLTNISDGTGESAVAKVDISTITFNGGAVPTYSVVDMIDYNIQGFTSVRLHWDHTADDEIAILPAGSGTIDFNAIGGKIDPRTAGGTGDIQLTTAGGASGATYDVTIYLRPK
jgi:hypothetical protein